LLLFFFVKGDGRNQSAHRRALRGQIVVFAHGTIPVEPEPR
jgi:hypothetical protein